jgi:alpha-glucosidase
MASLKWWQSAVFYQIYPRSFADGNGDGIGDFPGITSRLDYVRNLGVDAIWLSPHFPSPQADCGYDISDYTGVAPEYGTLDDFRTFLGEAHARHIRVVLDLVLNHTSIEHPWFQESRASRDNPKSDWYIWRDPAPGGGPPNNWVSPFAGGGSAWEYEPSRDQYYYHFFLKEQPDLNWRSPAVKQAMWEAMRFWLDMGVDGFRLDAIATIFEHPDMPDHTSTLTPDAMRRGFQETNADEEQRRRLWQELQRMMGYQTNQPGVHELMKDLRALLNEYPGDRVLVGEDDDLAYHGSGDNELHLVFNFPLMRVRRLTPAHVRANQRVRLAALPPGAWPCNTLGNHDSPRMWSRYGDGEHDAELARLHAALVLTLHGTPFLYNGEEIGMEDLELTELSQFRDEMALAQYRTMTTQLGMSPAEALAAAARATRDRCRTPMQWSDGPNAGFSPPGATTWLPVHPNHAAGVNVATQEGDPASLLSFYRRLLAVRRRTPALIGGAYSEVAGESEAVLAFTRATPDQAVLVALNFTDVPQEVAAAGGRPAHMLFSSAARAGDLAGGVSVSLAPFEVLIVELG